MQVRRIVHTLCGVVLLGVLATASTGAMLNARRTTHFTFRTAVALPGDRTKTYTLQFTRFVHRPAWGEMKSTISLGEAPTGKPQPIKTWFPENETTGREFLYYSRLPLSRRAECWSVRPGAVTGWWLVVYSYENTGAGAKVTE